VPISFEQIRQEDLKDPELLRLNELLRQISEEIAALSGSDGTARIGPGAVLDMQGARIINLGESQADGDALNKISADGLYSAEKLKKQFEAAGNQLLTTVRHLNDETQSETSSAFLDGIVSAAPGSNTSALTVVAAGANSDITLTAGTYTTASDRKMAYAGRLDTVANPGAGSDYYHYYLRYTDRTIQREGPFTADTSANRLKSNVDGRGFVALAKVNAGGGGAGGGGGDPVGGGGCTEIGTLLKFIRGSAQIEVVPCEAWIEIITSGGKRLVMAFDTLVSTWTKGQDLEEGALIEVEDGLIEQIVSTDIVQKKSEKMVVKSEPDHSYFAAGIRVHNFKII
jgi:hypothetical protein